MRSLLDVNVLIALIDPEHHSNERCHRWLERNSQDGWSSCAITQNGVVRIISQPAYNSTLTAAAATDLVADACAAATHEFWPCDVSLLDAALVERTRLLGPKQVTDVYLLALAVAHRGRFVTLDTAIDVHAVRGATEHALVTI